MGGLFLFAWGVPAVFGIWAGWWRAARPALTSKDFLRDIGVAALTAAIPIFMVHMVWVAAFMEATGGVTGVGGWASYWTALTGLIWLPLLVIAYIIRALKIRNEERSQ